MLTRISCLLFALLSSLPLTFAQGLLMDNAVYERLPRQSLYGDGGKSESSALDGISKIDLRPFCPKPQNQGRLGSCTAWATGYGAMSIAYAIQSGLEGQRDSISNSAFSSLFLYNQIREDFNDCGQGTYIHEALKLLKEKGNLHHRDFDRGNNCKKVPSAEDLEFAQQYRIKDWLTLFESGSSARVRIDKTKLSLADKKPVIIAMRTRNNFAELNAADKYWLPTVGDTALSFFHAMVVVGFDDGKGAFEVMNSWGEFWGNKGFFWLRYEDFAKHVPNAYQMTLFPTGTKPKNNTTKEKTLAAQFLVRTPTIIKDGEMQFDAANFVYKDGLFQLEDNHWPVGKRYQIVASNLLPGTYLYAFSLDATNHLNLHWPRDGALDEKFEGLNESAVISNSSVKLIIPEPQKVLVLEKAGTEHICLLLSKNPIANLNALIQNIKADKNATIDARIRRALEKEGLKSAKMTRNGSGIGLESAEGGVGVLVLKLAVE